MVRELATAIEAGLPLLNALKTARRQAAGKAQPVILDFVIERVEAGRPLHEAMVEYGPPFDEMIVGMVRAADASGRTSEVMHQLADLLDRSVELRREVVGATLYPMIVAFMILVSIVVAVTFLLPRLMEPILSQPGVTVPWPTQVLLAFADFMKSWWWLVVAGALAASTGSSSRRRSSGRSCATSRSRASRARSGRSCRRACRSCRHCASSATPSGTSSSWRRSTACRRRSRPASRSRTRSSGAATSRRCSCRS
jgi:type II secretory pathway component PulF